MVIVKQSVALAVGRSIRCRITAPALPRHMTTDNASTPGILVIDTVEPPPIGRERPAPVSSRGDSPRLTPKAKGGNRRRAAKNKQTEEAEGAMSEGLPAAPSLGAVWPGVDARLRALLAARGEVSRVDDIVQEVAVRALEHGVAFTDAADLYPWAATVARNLHISGLRDQARVIPTDTIPAQPCTEDVVETVHWRDVWTRALTHIAQMPAQDQTVLLSPIVADTSIPAAREPVRISVRRHRARASLRRRLGGFLSALLPAGFGWRLLRRQSAAVISGTAVAAALVVATGATVQSPSGIRVGPRAQVPTVFTRVAPSAALGRAQMVAPRHKRAPARTTARPSASVQEDRHLIVQPRRAPGVRVDETQPKSAKPLLCLHGAAVEGICTPSIRSPKKL